MPVPLREAMFYERLPGKEVRYRLCSRKCKIKNGERGECRNRENQIEKGRCGSCGHPVPGIWSD
jgi:hypothetical protein